MNEIKVSILVPAYNVETYIASCLDSLVHQTLQEVEIIVIDDGSTDQTGEIINQYAKTYSNLQVFHQENQGIVKTRSKLLTLARGKYVGWVDSDDYVELDMFEKLFNLAESRKAEVVLCNYNFFPSTLKTKKKWYKPYCGIVDWFFMEQNTQQWNKLVSTELLKRIGMSDLMRICGEGCYAFAFIYASSIASIDSELYHYRVGHTSLSNNLRKTSWYINNVTKTERQYEQSQKMNLSGNWNEYFQYWVIYSQIQLLIVAAYNGDKNVYQQTQKALKELKMHQNQYTKKVLDSNHGKLKSFVLRKIIPLNYYIAAVTSKVGLS